MLARTVVAILAWVGAAASALPGVCRGAAAPVAPEPRPRIVNGVDSQAYPSTGALLWSGGGPFTDGTAQGVCSATLIGCQTVLTAGHCASDPDPSHYRVFFQHAGLFEVAALRRHPSYTDLTFPIADVTVLTLAEPVTGIAPTPINQTDPLPFVPAAGTIVGFGTSGGNAQDYGIKRVGRVSTAPCQAGVPNNATDAEVVCWNFRDPIGQPGEDSNTCYGDSGGPLFLDLGAGAVVAGVTSGGTGDNCFDELSYDANVFAYRSFILGRLGSDSTAACGGLPPVGDARTTVVARAGTLAAGHRDDTFTVVVPNGANALRVTVNAQDANVFDADLYVKHGAGAGPTDFDCASDGRALFKDCVIDHPATGEWSVRVARGAGNGAYQMTATVFGGPPSQCGDGVAEFDEACDGADDRRCHGLCGTDCTCPPPVCGNGVTEAGEECDGSDDAACPSACDAGRCACVGAGEAVIACGETIDAALAPTDPTLPDGTWGDVYAVTLVETVRVQLAMSAPSFEAYVLVLDGGGSVLAEGRPPLELTLLPGRYVVLANNFALLPDGVYSYQLSATCASRTAVPIACGSHVGGALDPQDALLGDATWVEPYALSIAAATTATLTMSGGFDGYLFVLTPAGGRVASGSSPFTVPLDPGDYVIGANNYSKLPDGSYAYTLAVACGGATACAGDCSGDGRVDIGDLVQAVAISLGSTPATACAAADGDGDSRVGVAELIRAVKAALTGCAP